MKPLVIDASVATKWLIREEDTDAARALLKHPDQLIAPDLVFAEVGQALWKQQQRGTLSPADSLLAQQTFEQVPLTTTSCRKLLASALRFASVFQQTVYDSLYLALAVREQTVVVTADRRFLENIKQTPLAQHIRWVTET